MTRAYVRRWTDERVALLRAEAPTCVDPRGLFERINALPGPPIQDLKAVREKMAALGIKRAPGVLRQILSNAARRSNVGMERPARIRTAERRAVMLAEYATTPNDVLMERLNALPGDPIKRSAGLCEWASQLGLRKARQTMEAVWRGYAEKHAQAAEPTAEVPPAMTPEQSAAIADAAIERRYAKARAALARRDADPMKIAAAHKLPPREVFRLAGELRRERAAA